MRRTDKACTASGLIAYAVLMIFGPSPGIADPIADRLDGMERPELALLWRAALELEARNSFPEANVYLADLVTRLPDSPDPHWRIARNIYQHSKSYGDRETDLQIAMLDRAIAAADRGLERDGECAQCMLWKYAALGRLPTLQGLLSGARNAKLLAELLRRGIEVSEKRDDPRTRATLAHLYYARASFQRMVPDWFWLDWAFGVRGNKQRALEDARRAIELDGSRSEFELELAANLLCLGHRKGLPTLLDEADRVLQRVRKLPTALQSDPKDPELAELLLERPREACAFSRDGFVDVDGAARSQGP